MKKLILLFAIALFATSCEGPMGPQGPEGLQGYGTNWKIINLVANSADWKESTDAAGLNRYYSCGFKMPEINSTVFNDGTVIAYIKINNVQQVLPYVRHYQNANGNMWTQTIDFEYSEGTATLFVTNSDFVKEIPGKMDFRMVLMW